VPEVALETVNLNIALLNDTILNKKFSNFGSLVTLHLENFA
jgi:hypothetical protein